MSKVVFLLSLFYYLIDSTLVNGMSTGQKLISFYFLKAYLFAIIGNIIFKEEIISSYKLYPLTYIALISIFSIYFLYLAISRAFSLSDSYINLSYLHSITKILNVLGTKYLNHRFSIAWGMTLFSLLYFFHGFSSYRYGTTSLSEINSPMLFACILMESVITFDLFYFFFLRHTQNIDISKKTYFSNILFASSLILLANGTGSAFIAFILFFASIAPKKFNIIIFKEANLAFHKRLLYLMLHTIIFVFIIILAWNHGEAIKNVSLTKNPLVILKSSIGFWQGKAFKDNFSENIKNNHAQNEQTAQNTNSQNTQSAPEIHNTPNSNSQNIQLIKENLSHLSNFLLYLKSFSYYFIERSSIYYYSFLYTVNENINLQGSPIIYPFNNMLFRMDYLFFRGMLGFKRPDPGSICSLNYQLLSKVIVPNKGSAPGLLASFNYVFTFPFNFIFCIFYLVILSSLIDRLFSKTSNKISFFGILIIFLLFEIFFQSPFDILIIFDSTMLQLLLIIGLILACGQQNIKFNQR